MKLSTLVTVFIIFLVVIPLFISITYRYFVFPKHITEASNAIHSILDQVAEKNLQNTARAVNEFLISEREKLLKVVATLSEDQKIKDYAKFSLLGTLNTTAQKIISASGVDKVDIYIDDKLLATIGSKEFYPSIKVSKKTENITFVAYRFFSPEYLKYLSERFEAQFILENDGKVSSTLPLSDSYGGKVFKYNDRFYMGKTILFDNTQITVLIDTTEIHAVYETVYNDLKIQEEQGENRFFLLWFLAIIPSASLLWLGFRSVIRPVQKGIDAVKKISAGNYDIALDTTRTVGESKGLFEAINDLSTNLKNLITENAQKTLSLRKEKEKLETIIQNLDDGVLILDKGSKPVLYNDLGLKAYKNIKNSTLPKNLVLANGNQYQKLTVRNKEIKGIGQIIVFHDVTLEDEMRQLFIITENLKQFEKTARTMAHEIKNPLNAISLNLQILMEKLEKKTYGTLMQTLLNQINLIASSIDKLLTISSEIDEYHKTNIGNIIERVISLFKFQSIEEKVKINLINNSHSEIYCDSRRLSQAFFNLIHNAFKSLQHQEHDREICITIDETEKEAIISIEDSGPGIPEKFANNVFVRPFTLEKGGHGIGLMLVKNIIENHNGKISYSNSKLGGAKFDIILPIRGDFQ
ncbi:MAG: GHKL domain-containing protein [Kosmotoga sp.]|uniref:sensor histidine kinase n=1 Tax=Kosmotoga sp. TaxID=1955248 RepID=UPI001DBEF18F|nr:ATP-binding protein [Kosmotoga sp.]MBO8165771.1 GHKL domain-containing protein [Kosmotoga sp.]